MTDHSTQPVDHVAGGDTESMDLLNDKVRRALTSGRWPIWSRSAPPATPR